MANMGSKHGWVIGLWLVACAVDPNDAGDEPVDTQGSADAGDTDGVCVGSYGTCAEEDAEYQMGCCDLEDTCVYDAFLDVSVCVEPCTQHEECFSGCCVYTLLGTGAITACAPSLVYCLGEDLGGTGIGLCIETCATALDGVCNDGGPGSADATCAYGTDCDDCGAR